MNKILTNMHSEYYEQHLKLARRHLRSADYLLNCTFSKSKEDKAYLKHVYKCYNRLAKILCKVAEPLATRENITVKEFLDKSKPLDADTLGKTLESIHCINNYNIGEALESIHYNNNSYLGKILQNVWAYAVHKSVALTIETSETSGFYHEESQYKEGQYVVNNVVVACYIDYDKKQVIEYTLVKNFKTYDLLNNVLYNTNINREEFLTTYDKTKNYVFLKSKADFIHISDNTDADEAERLITSPIRWKPAGMCYKLPKTNETYNGIYGKNSVLNCLFTIIENVIGFIGYLLGKY